jgi:hypothetical protein
MYHLLDKMTVRKRALEDKYIQCVVGEECRMIAMQIDIIAEEKETIEDRMRATGREV